jgi:hypothetical protein
MNFLDGNRLCGARVDHARVVLYGDELAFISERGVVLLDQAIDLCAERWDQM